MDKFPKKSMMTLFHSKLIAGSFQFNYVRISHFRLYILHAFFILSLFNITFIPPTIMLLVSLVCFFYFTLNIHFEIWKLVLFFGFFFLQVRLMERINNLHVFITEIRRKDHRDRNIDRRRKIIQRSFFFNSRKRRTIERHLWRVCAWYEWYTSCQSGW